MDLLLGVRRVALGLTGAFAARGSRRYRPGRQRLIVPYPARTAPGGNDPDIDGGFGRDLSAHVGTVDSLPASVSIRAHRRSAEQSTRRAAANPGRGVRGTGSRSERSPIEPGPCERSARRLYVDAGRRCDLAGAPALQPLPAGTSGNTFTGFRSPPCSSAFQTGARRLFPTPSPTCSACVSSLSKRPICSSATSS